MTSKDSVSAFTPTAMRERMAPGKCTSLACADQRLFSERKSTDLGQGSKFCTRELTEKEHHRPPRGIVIVCDMSFGRITGHPCFVPVCYRIVHFFGVCSV